MATTISCEDMGHACGDEVSGNTVEELIRAVQQHAMPFHDFTEVQAQAPEKIQEWRAAIRQASRPPELRTPRHEI